jgi:hypothetical protein
MGLQRYEKNLNRDTSTTLSTSFIKIFRRFFILSCRRSEEPLGLSDRNRSLNLRKAPKGRNLNNPECNSGSWESSTPAGCRASVGAKPYSLLHPEQRGYFHRVTSCKQLVFAGRSMRPNL